MIGQFLAEFGGGHHRVARKTVVARQQGNGVLLCDLGDLLAAADHYREATVCSVMRRAASAGEMVLTSILTVSSSS